jgi:UDP-N-acetylglucosamine--N-acetylmuramyl-(pentapeptide) pyrophosphoryl-undecaprenol N-acetylglucosamine transferase
VTIPKKKLAILIVAGGTGGHLFPARLIAQAFQESSSDAQIEFIGTGRPLEAQIIDSQGFKRHVVASAGINGRGILGILQFIVTLPSSLLKTRAILREFKPDAVIGVGGYVTVIPLLMAALNRIPTLIHEAEIHPGMANKLLGRFVDQISVSFQQAEIGPRSKVFYAGQPLRSEMKALLNAAPYCPSTIKKILIIGGSLGAKRLDIGFIEIAPTLAQYGVEIWHQTRPEMLDEVLAAYQATKLNANVVSFIDNIADAYRWADIVVARAGASTVMELTVLGRPVIFVPLPARGDHQLLNARVLEDQGKALVVEQGERFSERLLNALKSLLEANTYREMSSRPVQGRNVDGAERIVSAVLALVDKKAS